MKEYIERAAVKDEILSWAVCINHPELLSKEDTMYCIDNIPAADVAPVRYGQWLPQIVLGKKAWDCSECKTLGSPHWKWCPNCGARMNKEDE